VAVFRGSSKAVKQIAKQAQTSGTGVVEWVADVNFVPCFNAKAISVETLVGSKKCVVTAKSWVKGISLLPSIRSFDDFSTLTVAFYQGTVHGFAKSARAPAAPATPATPAAAPSIPVPRKYQAELFEAVLVYLSLVYLLFARLPRVVFLYVCCWGCC
jgi:hypothetical protein